MQGNTNFKETEITMGVKPGANRLRMKNNLNNTTIY
jgi:hypothetical protein